MNGFPAQRRRLGQPEDWQGRLSEEILMRHLNEYGEAQEDSGKPFGATTPFILAMSTQTGPGVTACSGPGGVVVGKQFAAGLGG
jgi:hypothetical protein